MASGAAAQPESEPGPDLASFRLAATLSGSNFRPLVDYLLVFVVDLGVGVLLQWYDCHEVKL